MGETEMKEVEVEHRAPMYGAKTRRGTPCQSPAVRGKRRCRMHGGATGSGAPSGKRNGNYRNGRTGQRESIAATRATSSIPIVTIVNPDPIAMGMAQSLSKPSGNVTGLTTMDFDIYGKR